MLRTLGDIWGTGYWFKVIPTNGSVNRHGECVMGRGVALQVKQMFPDVPCSLGALIKRNGNHVYLMSCGLVSFPVKHEWWEKADLILIDRSCRELVALADTLADYHTFLLPLVGCGNGRLSPRSVVPVLDAHLDDRFTLITEKPLHSP